MNQFEKRYGTSPTIRLIERMRDRIGADVQKIEGEYAAEAAADPTGRLAGTPLGRVDQLIDPARRVKFGAAGQDVPPEWVDAVGEATQTRLADLYGEEGRGERQRSIIEMDPTPDFLPRITSELEQVLAGQLFLSESRAEKIPLTPKPGPHELRGLMGSDPQVSRLPAGTPATLGEARVTEDPLGGLPPLEIGIEDSPLLEETRVAG